MTSTKGPLAAIALGAVTGIRGMAGPTAVAHLGVNPRLGRARRAFDVLALAEVAADKLAPLPARSEPLPLLGRVLFGAATGWLLSRRVRDAVLGGVAATVAAVAIVRARRAASTIMPDFVAGFVEDAIVAATVLSLR